jgi:hypothetical protein
MTLASAKALLHLAGRIRRVVDADDIYSLEAQGDETDVPTARKGTRDRQG